MEGERKLVTIVFADLSGYTALSETLDPETVRDLINACFGRLVPVLEKYGGTVDKFIGDEIMALFGAPRAAENGPELALRAALEMRDSLAGFNADHSTNLGFHFGINTGLVVAGGIGPAGTEHYSVTGDAVNLASRLEHASARGEILVGPETYRLSSGAADFEKLESLKIKGKSEPVQVYRLLRMKTIRTPHRGPTGKSAPFVGRQTELRQVRAALHELARGHGGILAIAGEAGLGKSRLVAEARQGSEGAAWAEARASALAERVPYGVIGELFRGLLGLDSNTPPDHVVGHLRRNVGTLFGERSPDVFPYLAQLCGLPLEETSSEKVKYLAPEALHRQMVRAFQEYVRCRASSFPLVLVWEDLHWIDPSSLRLLEGIFPLSQETPLLLVLLFRSAPEGAVGEFHHRARESRGRNYQCIELKPLDSSQSSELLQGLLKVPELPARIREMILAKAEGNPFFLEEVLRSLVEAGAVVLQEGRAVVLPGLEAIEIPGTLQGLIGARIDRLALEHKQTLQAAAVIGRTFQERVLAQLRNRGRDDKALQTALAELELRELIGRLEEVQNISDYIFRHAVTHDVAYNSLLLARRRALHQEVGAAIEALFPEGLDELAPVLAYHYERAGVHDRALRYLVKAAERARAAYANEEAIAFYRAALKQTHDLHQDRTADQAARASALHERLGDTLMSSGRYEESRRAYGDALAGVPESHRVQRARLLRLQGNSFYEQRRFHDSLAQYDLAEAVLASQADGNDAEWWKERLALLIERTGVCYFLNRLEELSNLLREAQDIATRYGTPFQRREVVESLNLLRARQSRFYLPPDDALRRAQTNLAESRETGDLSEIASRQFGVGMCQLWREEFQDATATFEEALALATRIGHVALQTKCCTYLAVAHRRLGRVKDTLECVTRSLSLATASENVSYIATARGNLAWVRWREGNFAEAEQQARAALDSLSDGQFAFKWIILWPLLGLALARDAPAEAIDYARAILAPEGVRMPDDMAEALEMALREQANGQTDRTRGYLQRASHLARERGYL
jgi:class 3 adenylate cyclase/tetratricopeptide (TPR) repeat protein